jgi:hypothetical protein
MQAAVAKPHDAVLRFGMHEGCYVSDVARRAPHYIFWLIAKGFARSEPILWLALRDHALKLLQEENEQYVRQQEAYALR